jgi:ribosomal protein S18 acetylase RimI-like enzyme
MTFLISLVKTIDEQLVTAFARLIPQLNPAYQPPSREQLESILNGGATELLVAADETNHAIIGALALVVFSTPTGTHAWIEDVVVDEAWRGQGVGQALTSAAIQRAAERGAKAVDLTSRPNREAANRLYLKMGFQPRPTNLYRYPLTKKAS